MNLKLSLFDIGTKSNSIIEALLVSSSIKLLRSESPGQPKSPDEAPPIDSLGPVASSASPDDKIIPSLNGNPPLGSKKCAIPLTSPKSFPLLHDILETFAHKLLINTSVTNSSTV